MYGDTDCADEEETLQLDLNEAQDVAWSPDDDDDVGGITPSCSSEDVAVCDDREITSNRIRKPKYDETEPTDDEELLQDRNRANLEELKETLRRKKQHRRDPVQLRTPVSKDNFAANNYAMHICFDLGKIATFLCNTTTLLQTLRTETTIKQGLGDKIVSQMAIDFFIKGLNPEVVNAMLRDEIVDRLERQLENMRITESRRGQQFNGNRRGNFNQRRIPANRAPNPKSLTAHCHMKRAYLTTSHHILTFPSLPDDTSLEEFIDNISGQSGRRERATHYGTDSDGKRVPLDIITKLEPPIIKRIFGKDKLEDLPNFPTQPITDPRLLQEIKQWNVTNSDFLKRTRRKTEDPVLKPCAPYDIVNIDYDRFNTSNGQCGPDS
ncbi:unnamed protein product [Heligmosomoides polygyrus]|uniref:Reverse transcriptase domain-containing protein n=1 Tax=Heligmosomoides polygyrus TaxID=6339 RepID=A0A183FY28_HELPZ|nr:unnamed protein product [Heligmosomoides polygyrus]